MYSEKLMLFMSNGVALRKLKTNFYQVLPWKKKFLKLIIKVHSRAVKVQGKYVNSFYLMVTPLDICRVIKSNFFCGKCY